MDDENTRTRMPFQTKNERADLVGREIAWANRTPTHTSSGAPYPYAPIQAGQGTVIEAAGDSLLVDKGGVTDWLDKQDVAWIELVEDHTPAPKGP